MLTSLPYIAVYQYKVPTITFALKFQPKLLLNFLYKFVDYF